MKINVKAKVQFNEMALNNIRNIREVATVETSDNIKNKEIKDQVMPYKSGAMQNRQTKTILVHNTIYRVQTSLVTDTYYAKWVYFPESPKNDIGKPLKIHDRPGINERCDVGHKRYNKNAQGHWHEEMVNGETGRDYILRCFKRNFRRYMK